MKLIKITTNKFDVNIDLAYAKTSNFTGKKIYKNANCYIHKDAIGNLNKAIFIASKIGYKIKILDAFRPSEAQKALWKEYPNPNFITPPRKGSPHSRGIAIDLTLEHNNKILDMGTDFDHFSEESFHGNTEINISAQTNRMLLLGIMTTAGWDFYKNEWWHYQLYNSKKWPVLSDKVEKTRIMN